MIPEHAPPDPDVVAMLRNAVALLDAAIDAYVRDQRMREIDDWAAVVPLLVGERSVPDACDALYADIGGEG